MIDRGCKGNRCIKAYFVKGMDFKFDKFRGAAKFNDLRSPFHEAAVVMGIGGMGCRDDVIG